ncbi:hypothetical protein RhiirA1_523603 [Rhizophagus irregularis]|uniref:Ion transport domain-containing protein n=1 Tax=Rhizophagus irregularis TaxID=588596 RepID=A0A2N0REP8_9GLOM|nr:hypothetical protein RhiirA1_523603 [Rhizophagus irregularis]
MIDYTDLTPKEIEATVKESQELIAFNLNMNLISTKDEKQKSISLRLKKLYMKIFSNTENLSPTVKIIPLRNFTVCKRYDKQKNRIFLSKIFQAAFIPRGYLKNIQLSPLVQIVRNEKDDDIFDNPAMEAAINYKWVPTRNYFLRVFFIYILFAACFAALVGCYLGHVETTGHLRNFLVFLFILFYYSGIYLFLVEYRQFQHHGWRHYVDFFNFVDLASVVISTAMVSVYITPSFKLTNAFADVVATSNITAGFSSTMLLLWFEFILYLRLFSEPAKFIYIILNIIKRTYLFVFFMLLVVLALSHVFLLLLQHTDFSDLDDITPKTSSYTIQNSASETVGTSVVQDFNRKLDNPSKDFGTSFLSTYAWLRGSYPQQATWNFWAVEALTLIEPKYIYYLGKSKSYDTWEGIVKKRKLKKFYEDLERDGDENSLLNYKKLVNKRENINGEIIDDDNISRSDKSLDKDHYENDGDEDENNADDVIRSMNCKINEIYEILRQ